MTVTPLQIQKAIQPLLNTGQASPCGETDVQGDVAYFNKLCLGPGGMQNTGNLCIGPELITDNLTPHNNTWPNAGHCFSEVFSNSNIFGPTLAIRYIGTQSTNTRASNAVAIVPDATSEAQWSSLSIYDTWSDFANGIPNGVSAVQITTNQIQWFGGMTLRVGNLICGLYNVFNFNMWLGFGFVSNANQTLNPQNVLAAQINANLNPVGNLICSNFIGGTQTMPTVAIENLRIDVPNISTPIPTGNLPAWYGFRIVNQTPALGAAQLLNTYALAVDQSTGTVGDVGSYIYGETVLGGLSGSPQSTTATRNFLWIPGTVGPPTGVPARNGVGMQNGHVPIQIDTTNNRLYWYNGTWHYVQMTA